MKEAEEKILKAQVVLYEEIVSIDDMIIHTVQNTANRLFNDIIKEKMYMKEGQTTVTLSTAEFNELRIGLVRLSNNDGFKMLNEYLDTKYLRPKEEKLKIIRMLK